MLVARRHDEGDGSDGEPEECRSEARARPWLDGGLRSSRARATHSSAAIVCRSTEVTSRKGRISTTTRRTGRSWIDPKTRSIVSLWKLSQREAKKSPTINVPIKQRTPGA